MTSTPAAVDGIAYASEIDAFAHGEYHPHNLQAPPSFTRRIETPETAGRYHLYVSWASIPSHHVAILRLVLGLEKAVSLSYVDSLRDGRGWAFRGRTGADPVNGFTLLREAYLASDPGFTGEVRVPLLWDRHTGAIASDDPEAIAADMIAKFHGRSVPSLATGPRMAAAVDCLAQSFSRELDPVAALRDPGRRPSFQHALSALDRRLGAQTYLAGEALSDADIRLWVRLARLDAGPNASGVIGPRLDRYPHLWRWATALYDLPAFRDSTDFRRFATPLTALPPWTSEPRVVNLAGSNTR
jgi:putative glutathione S-transferase